MREIQPDDFVAVDGSIQTITASDYAAAAEAMLNASETVTEPADEVGSAQPGS